MDLGDNPLKNGINAIPKMMVGEKVDRVKSLVPVAECRTNHETVAAPCDGSTAQQVNLQHPYKIAQFGSLIGFLASAALIAILGAVLVRRGRK
jgi:hypothetical protein